MQFIDKVKNKFIEKGWHEGRDVSSEYTNESEIFNQFPDFLKDFLKEYGALTIDDKGIKVFESKVVNLLHLETDMLEVSSQEEEGYKYVTEILGKELYVFGCFYPDGYELACDIDGNVYMLGDYIFLIANNIKEGIEKLLKHDWSDGYLQLNEESGLWEESENYNVKK